MGPPLHFASGMCSSAASLLQLLLMLLASGGRSSVAVAAGAAPPPNFLMVLADDTGWGDVGFNRNYLQPPAGGGKFTPNPPRTPQLDAWATGPGSIIFDRFYSGNPVCSPTRAALLSGRTPFRDCIQGANEQQPFPAVTPTVAQQVKLKGYRTLMIGSEPPRPSLQPPPLCWLATHSHHHPSVHASSLMMLLQSGT